MMSQKDKKGSKQRVRGIGKVKVEVYCKEVIEKVMKGEGTGSARIYLPLSWTGCLVKILKVG